MCAVSAAAARNQSLTNLSIAANCECNAAIRYESFAETADREGYLKVGSLFRAASHSQQIQAANHTATLMKMGGDAMSDIESFHIKTTVENLKASINSQLLELNDVYPEFLSDAESKALADARRSLDFAIASEQSHIELFVGILDQLEHPDEETRQALASKQAYHVCPACGLTSEAGNFDACPICNQPCDLFDRVD